MKLPVRLSCIHAHLFSGDHTYWFAKHETAAQRWSARLAMIPRENVELRAIYQEMLRNAGQWARQSYEKCVEEYLANG